MSSFPSPAPTMMSSLDLTTPIEDADPSLLDGHHAVYDREVPLELRSHEQIEGGQTAGTLEAVKVKVLLLGEDTNPQHVRIELTTESDLFFVYNCNLDLQAFKVMQTTQKLMIEYPEFPSVIVRMLNQCIKEPHSHLAVFVYNKTGDARLDFIQNMEYKFVELLSLNFSAADMDTVKRVIHYRYNVMKARLQTLQSRLHDVNAIVKIKNPSLLLQLQKSPGRTSAPPSALRK